MPVLPAHRRINLGIQESSSEPYWGNIGFPLCPARCDSKKIMKNQSIVI